MTCVNQGIMPSHFLYTVNLSNYELSYMLKNYHTSVCFHT